MHLKISIMKLIVRLVLLSLLPLVSGCFTCMEVYKAKGETSSISKFDLADRIEKAGITKDGQLCIFFEKDLTNSPKTSRFSLAIPLSLFQTNAHFHDELVSADHRSTTFIHGPIIPPGYIQTKYWSLDVSGGTVRKNWALLKDSKGDLKFIPAQTTLTPKPDWTALHGESFVLSSNATQIVYLTRTNPIEFVYVDSLTNQPYTIIAVAPTVISKRHRHPAYYALLPVTIPIDIILSPYELFCFIEFASGNWRM